MPHLSGNSKESLIPVHKFKMPCLSGNSKESLVPVH